MHRIGCHIWAGPNVADLQLAARVHPSAPELLVPTDHPHLQTIAGLWPNSTIRTIGPHPIELGRPLVAHHNATTSSLELHAIDRPRHTIICPTT